MTSTRIARVALHSSAECGLFQLQLAIQVYRRCELVTVWSSVAVCVCVCLSDVCCTHQ